MKKAKKFNVGDKVFAKVKGYPPWPAIVEEPVGKKCKVKFYGTGEIGQIKVEEIFYYSKNKSKLLKPSKRKDYNDGIEEIEKAIEECGTDGDTNDNDTTIENLNDSELIQKSNKRKLSTSDKSVDENNATESKKKALSLEFPSEQEKIDSKVVDADSEFRETSSDSENILKDVETINDESTSESKEIEEVTTITEENLIFEHELNSFITYGNHVESHEDHYKADTVEKRLDNPKQVLPVFLESGQVVGIKFHRKWPLNFDNEYRRALYDREASKEVLRLRAIFTEDDLQKNPDFYIPKLSLDRRAIEIIQQEKLVEIERNIVKHITKEKELLDINSKIRNCLGLEKADPKAALTHLKDMLNLDISEFMLKKHIHVVDMVRRLRKYIGNTQTWNLDPSALTEFQNDAEKIREIAEEMYLKIKTIVNIPSEVETFWDGFNEVVNKFREQTADLSNNQILLLCGEPHSRKTFLYNYIIEEKNLKLILD